MMHRKNDSALMRAGWIIALALIMLAPSAHAQVDDQPAEEEKPPETLQDLPKPVIESLFFSTNETNQIRLAIATYVKNTAGNEADLTLDEEDFLKQLTDKKGKDIAESHAQKSYAYPQFFLESLVYHSPTDWSVWINGHKLTSTMPQDADLTITSIDHDKVGLEWRPANMEKVNSVWEKSPGSGIDVDSRRGIVSFSLHMNQTFSSYIMRVVEGKMQPVTVGEKEETPNLKLGKVNEKSLLSLPDARPAAADPVSPPHSAPVHKEGLSGLLDMYNDMKNDNKP